LFVGDDTFLAYTKDAVWWNFDAKIGNCISLTITKASDDGFFVIGKDFIDGCQQLYFKLIRSLLYHLSPEGDEVVLRTHEQGSRGKFHAI